MTFKPGQSGNPAGRPRGVRNRGALMREALVSDEDFDAIVADLVREARAGSADARAMLLDRLWPRLRPVAPTVEVEMEDGLTLLQKAERIVDSATRGAISSDSANDLLSALGAVARLKENADFEARLDALESDAPGAKE